ncbi:MauE/DoxX family redox-associated membrane protein [Novosphingobium sp.]|uniref:MauE/DoxX family redox-associated membrane protein n=1 Tax=Novosphingobium sp. TaxID=1874826 RepID=UPI00334086E8
MLAITLFLAAVLALSAAHKLQAPDRMIMATGRLAGVTGPSALILTVLAGAVEAIAALCLVLPGATVIGAATAAGLWAVYAGALWRRRGAVLDCGCDLVARPRAVGTAQVARPLVLAVLALASIVVPQFVVQDDGMLAIDVLAACGGLALYLAATEILAIPYPRWRTS